MVLDRKKFISSFLNKIWFPSFLNKMITKIVQTGTVNCKPGSGKKRKMRIAQNVVETSEYIRHSKSIISKSSCYRRFKDDATNDVSDVRGAKAFASVAVVSCFLRFHLSALSPVSIRCNERNARHRFYSCVLTVLSLASVRSVAFSCCVLFFVHCYLSYLLVYFPCFTCKSKKYAMTLRFVLCVGWKRGLRL